MRSLIAGAALAALLPAAAFAAGADSDGDGRITREELQVVHASLFEQLDRNKDGVVSRGRSAFPRHRRSGPRRRGDEGRERDLRR